MHRPSVQETQRINITAVMRKLHIELSTKYDTSYWKHIRTQEEAERVKELINNSYTRFESLEVPQHDSAMQVDFIASNLGKGYVFYFVCKCDRRVVHLYQTSKDQPLQCRQCAHLKYKKRADWKYKT